MGCILEVAFLLVKTHELDENVQFIDPGVASLTYPPSSIPPGIINLGPTYRGYIQPRFNIPPGVYGT